MKQNGICIAYDIRKLIQEKDLQRMVTDLYKNRNKTDEVNIYLPLANKRLNDICEDPFHRGSDKIDDLCFGLNDTTLLQILENLKVLKIITYSDDDDGEGGGMGFIAAVTINNPEYVKHLYEWVTDAGLILNYGIFSLHTFTGEAYCLDNQYMFHSNKGLFHVFRGFLSSESHILDYKTIYTLSRKGEQKVLLKNMTQVRINEIIGDLKDRLLMKGKLSKLFMASSNQYLLKPSLD